MRLDSFMAAGKHIRLYHNLKSGPVLQGRRVLMCFAILLLSAAPKLHAQITDIDMLPTVGDAPSVALPFATDVSGKFDRKDISRAMRKVANWQLNRSTANFNQKWTFAALYDGLLAVPDAAGGRKYHKAVKHMGEKFQWQPGPRPVHADDQAIGQAYLDLYQQYHDPAMLAPIRERMESIMRLPDDKKTPLWSWCDALFMAPPVLAKLYKVTGDRRYIDFMDRQWWITSDLLYDRDVHLFHRDASFIGKHEANGSGLFWSRGNGWVMAALVRVLADLPSDYPTRPKYIAQYKEMAAEIASLQGKDGLWRTGLLDAEAYKLPENSGSAFYVYALAYGVNNGILDRTQYLPIVEKAWTALVAHIYQDGRLGCIQTAGTAPGDYPATASYVFGTGAFLMAGSEVYQLAR